MASRYSIDCLEMEFALLRRERESKVRKVMKLYGFNRDQAEQFLAMYARICDRKRELGIPIQ